jgi:hypothetical protein
MSKAAQLVQSPHFDCKRSPLECKGTRGGEFRNPNPEIRNKSENRIAIHVNGLGTTLAQTQWAALATGVSVRTSREGSRYDP